MSDCGLGYSWDENDDFVGNHDNWKGAVKSEAGEPELFVGQFFRNKEETQHAFEHYCVKQGFKRGL